MDWQGNVLFSGLTSTELEEVSRRARRLALSPGEILLRDGEPAAELFVVESGALEAIKADPATGSEALLSRSLRGDVIGEVALIDRGVRSATVRAVEASALLAIPFETLRLGESDAGGAALHGAYVKMLQNLAVRLSSRLRASAEDALRQAVDRVNMGLFVVSTISLLALYILLLALLPGVQGRIRDSSLLSIPLLLVFGLTTLYFVRRSGLPAQAFGLGAAGAARALAEGLLFAVPMLLGVVLAKWLWMQTSAGSGHGALLEWREVRDHYGRYLEWGVAVVYALFTFVQEFIARSGLQAPLERFLVGRHRTAVAILLSNLLFALTHLHVSPWLSLAVFFAGLFWGWMFRRHRSLLGCWVNHLVVGTFIFFVLGV